MITKSGSDAGFCLNALTRACGDGETLTALCPATLENNAAVLGLHALAEPVHFCALPLFRLVRSLWHMWRKGYALKYNMSINQRRIQKFSHLAADLRSSTSVSQRSSSTSKTKTERLRFFSKMCTTHPSCPHIQVGYPHFHPLSWKIGGFSTCG